MGHLIIGMGCEGALGMNKVSAHASGIARRHRKDHSSNRKDHSFVMRILRGVAGDLHEDVFLHALLRVWISTVVEQI